MSRSWTSLRGRRPGHRVSTAGFLSEPPPLGPGPPTSCPRTPPWLLGFAHHLPPSGAPRGCRGSCRREEAGEGHGGPGGLGPESDAPPSAGRPRTAPHGQHPGDALPRSGEHWGQALRLPSCWRHQQQCRWHARWLCPGSSQQLSAAVPVPPRGLRGGEGRDLGAGAGRPGGRAGWGGRRCLLF